MRFNKSNVVQFSVVCTLIDCDIRHRIGQNLGLVSRLQILTTVVTNVVIDELRQR